MKSRGIALLAGLAALMVAGVVAGAGAAGTSALAAGNIVYAGVDPKDGVSDVYVVKADGSAKTNLTDDGANRKDVSPELSRDGSRIVFVRHPGTGGTHLMVVNADGSGLTDVTPANLELGDIAEPSWSPDGTQIVFSANADGNYDLFVLDLVTGKASRLTKTSAPVQNVDPAWSPTGQAIAFSRSGLSSITRSVPASLYQLKLGSTASPARLTKAESGAGDVSPVYSPDGKQIAFSSDRAGQSDVYVLDLAGFALTQVTRTKHRDVQPSYAPDGTALVYVSNRSGATELWAQSLVGLISGSSSPGQVTSDGAPKSHPSWGPAAAEPVPVPPGADPVETAGVPGATSKSPSMPSVAVVPPAA